MRAQPESEMTRSRLRREYRRQIDLAHRSMMSERRQFQVQELGRLHTLTVTREGVGPIQTEWGAFTFFTFHINDMWKKYSALVRGEVDDNFVPHFSLPDGILVRLDSGCETGQVFHDLTCECRDQLSKAMEVIVSYGEGVIVNIPGQDGRGMGLPFKLATLRLQEELDHNTVEAAALLAPSGTRDVRTYGGAIAVLRFLQIGPENRIKLATNNPHKTSIFEENGYRSEYYPITIPPTAHTVKHLTAKQLHLDHIGLVEDASRSSEYTT